MSRWRDWWFRCRRGGVLGCTTFRMRQQAGMGFPWLPIRSSRGKTRRGAGYEEGTREDDATDSVGVAGVVVVRMRTVVGGGALRWLLCFCAQEREGKRDERLQHEFARDEK